MKSMRQLINLMEGVMAVPGINPLNELSSDTLRDYSKRRGADVHADQRDAKGASDMAASSIDPKKTEKWNDEADWLNKRAEKGAGNVAKATSKIAAKREVKEELIGSDSESDMQTAGTVGRNASDSEFDSAQQPATESAPPGMEDVVMKLKKEYPNDHSKAFATAWSIYNKKHGKAEEGCTMEEGVSDLIYDQQYSRFSDLMNSFVEPQEAFDMLSKEMAEQGIEGEEHDAIMQRLENDFFPDDSAFDMMNGPDDFSGDAEALASAGHGSDEDYGDFPVDEARSSDINPEEVKSLATMTADAAKARAQEIIAASTTSDNKKSYLANQINRARTAMDVASLMYNMILAGEGNAVQGSRYGKKFNSMEENLNNGYDTEEYASGNDFFPNGADSPVVRAVGPSGARQGDNPEQKRMQVAEVHKELVYGYRNFLKESLQETQKKKLTESAQVADIKIIEFQDNPHVDDSITYDGSIDLSATAINRNGQPTEIGYSVDVKAEAGLDWESDDSPTGWNYKTDNPTYTSYAYATSGDISITSVQFTNGAEYYIDNNAIDLQEFQQHFDPAVLKQLLDPTIYVKALALPFDNAAKRAELPEKDFVEPERDYGDSRY